MKKNLFKKNQIIYLIDGCGYDVEGYKIIKCKVISKLSIDIFRSCYSIKTIKENHTYYVKEEQIFKTRLEAKEEITSIIKFNIKTIKNRIKFLEENLNNSKKELSKITLSLETK